MSPAESGVITAPRSILMVISSSVWTWLLPRTGFRRPLVIGFIGYAGALTLVSMGLRDPVILGVPIATFWWAMGSVALGGVFFGLINPAMHNAGLDLAPDRIAAVAGLRGMFSVLGSTLGITVIVLIASRADDIGEGLRIGFVLMAVVILLATAFIAGVPAAPSGERRADRV
jgi:MFS family permease